MPLLQYYTLDGSLAAQENASSVSPDGTTVQAPVNNASSLIPGNYAGFVSNAGPNGTWNLVGASAVRVIGPFPPGIANVNITGSERSNSAYSSPYDQGTVSVRVNGLTKSASYGQYDNGSSIASALASAFNSDSGSPVTASANDGLLLLIKKPGSGANFTVSTTSQSNVLTGPPSFIATPSTSLTGSGLVNILGVEQFRS